jgi:radical SAM protein with 4Fe4S-binding SPASM domain
LLRNDFFDIYLYLKKKGFLISVFTNASLVTIEHVKFFKKYPPRDIEVTVYGVTQETYERVTRKPGSFSKFMNGLNLLLENDIRVRFKTMVLRSNIHELPAIAEFCRKRTKDYFRFDPFLHLRYDGNSQRNEEIRSERLSPAQIVDVEQWDAERFGALKKSCNRDIKDHSGCNHILWCGAGSSNFTIDSSGFFRLCGSLCHPDTMCDLKKVSLRYALEEFVPKVRDMRSEKKEFLEKCRKCPIFNLCLWCPARVYLETKELDEPVDYFCEMAHARAGALGMPSKKHEVFLDEGAKKMR